MDLLVKRSKVLRNRGYWEKRLSKLCQCQLAIHTGSNCGPFRKVMPQPTKIRGRFGEMGDRVCVEI